MMKDLVDFTSILPTRDESHNTKKVFEIGSEFARTKWLVFTDADIEFAPDFLINLLHIVVMT